MSEPFRGPVSRDAIVERIEAHPLGDTPPDMRNRFAALALGDGPGAAPPTDAGSEKGTILYLHGGGYVFGSPATHRRIVEGLRERTGWTVVAPRYPLAPEHGWPAQLDAALSAVPAGRVVLAGDSAGGHLALVAALELARRKAPVDGLVLFSPNTDRSGLSETRERNDPLDPMVDDEGDRELAKLCFGKMAPEHPHVSPVLDDLSLLPPTHVEVGAQEVLLGDSVILAERARAAGRAVTLHIEPQGLHMGQLWTPWWDVANASLHRAAAFLRDL